MAMTNGNSPTPAALLGATALSVRAGERTLVEALSVELGPGESLAVLGRNGCGKSLTLHTLAGLRAPAAGTVELGGRGLGVLSRGEIARRLALLPQDREDSLPLSVFETTLLGRHPHIGWLRGETAEDLRIVSAALARMGVAHCAERALGTLSGGEQPRAAMAGPVAQQATVVLVDEPTNHLDPHHQVDVLLAFRECCATGAAGIPPPHDPALAARCPDPVLLLQGDRRRRLGATPQLLKPEDLSALYATPIPELR